MGPRPIWDRAQSARSVLRDVENEPSTSIPSRDGFSIQGLAINRILGRGELYPDNLKVSQALTQYYARSGISPEAYNCRWVRLPVGKFGVYLPNLKSRRDVILLHDIDHVLAEYPTDWMGEFEIAGYELGAGLGKYWFGWMVNLQGIWIGLLLYPRKCFAAYARGRRSGCLFTRYESREVLFDKSLGEVRSELPVAGMGNVATVGDLVSFGVMLGSSAVIHITIILIGVVLIYLIYFVIYAS
jgi:hypothetical protein